MGFASLHPSYNPKQLLRRRRFRARRHHRDDGVGAVVNKFGIAPELFETAQRRNGVTLA